MSNIFSVVDIQRLIETFPPPEPRPGKTCLVRSRSGKNLIRSDAIIKRFRALLESSPIPLLVSNLPGELGVQDVRWLLDDESLGLFFTRDRQRIMSRPKQREIGESLRAALEDRGVKLALWAEQYGLSTDTLRRMTSRDLTLEMITLEDGLDYSKPSLQQTRSLVLGLLRDGADVPVNVSGEVKGRLPSTYLEKLCQELVSEDGSHVQGSFENRPDGLYFIPQSALSELQSQKEEAKKQYIESNLRALAEKGWCDVSPSHRPQLLQGFPPSSLGQEIETAYLQTQPTQSLISVQSSAAEDTSMCLVREDTLSTVKENIASSASQQAQRTWDSRVAGQDVPYNEDSMIEAFAERGSEHELEIAILTSAILRSEHTPPVKSIFETKIAELQESTTQHFTDLIRTKLLGPLLLCSNGAEGISDVTLQARVLEFTTDWARRTLTPEILLTIKDQKLVVSKNASRELDKFAEAAQAAKTLPEVTSAASKLARKLKIDQPDAHTLSEIKQSILDEKVAWLRRVKRGSDLLQNLTWILLASSSDGLFMSSGKDTSRMIKLYQSREEDSETGKRLGELRDIVKTGQESDAEKAEMREMARSAVLSGT